MPPLAQRQVYGIILLLVAAFGVDMITREAAPYAGVVAAIGAFALVWGGGGAAGPSLTPLRDAIERARGGKRPEPPPGASLEMVELYAGLGRLAEDNAELTRLARDKTGEI